MKNILLSLGVIITVISCSDKKDPAAEQAQMYIAPVYNNSDTAKAEAVTRNAAKATRKRVRTVAVKPDVPVAIHRDVIPEINTLPPVETSPVVTPPVASPAGVNTAPASAGPGVVQGTETASTVPEPEKKKGWSKAAKGAVIGAGAGAIGGAILSKKKGLGAVIGGVVGAAGGYVIGKGMDKKDNRLVAQY